MVHGSLLTICSVSYNSRPWLEINLDLAHRLNRHIDLIWLVAENSPVGSPLQVGSDSERFQVMQHSSNAPMPPGAIIMAGP